MGAGYTKEDDAISPTTEAAIKASGSLKKVRKSLQNSKSFSSYCRKNSTDAPDSKTGDVSKVPSAKQTDFSSDDASNVDRGRRLSGSKTLDKFECSNDKTFPEDGTIKSADDINDEVFTDETNTSNVGGKSKSEGSNACKNSKVTPQNSQEKNDTETPPNSAGLSSSSKTTLDEGTTSNEKNENSSQQSLHKQNSDPQEPKKSDFERSDLTSHSIDEEPSSTGDASSSTELVKSKKKDSRRWKMKKKASIDLDWSMFKFSTDGSMTRKQSVDGDDVPMPSHRTSKGSFDLGRVALRFTKRSSSDRGFDASALEEEPAPEELTEDQKVIIKETWALVKENIERVGVIMFTK